MSDRFQIVVPIVTPYRSDGELDLPAMTAHAARLAKQGVDGFFVAGTNGEGPLLSDDEVVAATSAVTAGAGGRSVVAQAGRNGTRATELLTRRVIAAGATAVAVVTPSFYALDADQAQEHYAALIAAAGPVPVYAYVIPAYARNDLSPHTAGGLAAAGLAGIKDSTKSLERHREYVAIRRSDPPRGFATFVGSDELTLAAWQMGSAGAVPALANVRPELFVKLVEAAERGDDPRAQALQGEVAETRASLRGRGIATLKHAVAQLMANEGHEYRDAVRGPLRQHQSVEAA